MNVLVVYPWDSFWSMGEQSGVASFFDAAHAYTAHGHTVDVVMPGDGPEQEHYRDMMLTRVAVGADPLDYGRGGVAGLAQRWWRYLGFRRAMVAAAREVSRRRRPNVVVGLGPHAAQVARTVALSCNVPNITRLFGQALILNMNDDGRIRDRVRFYSNFLEVLAFRTSCAALIVHDDGSRGDLVSKRLGVPPERLHFWRDGVDIPPLGNGAAGEEFKRQLGCPQDAVVAMSVGRLSPEKDLDRVVAAFAHTAAPELHLVFVGDGPSRGEIEEQIRQARVLDRVHFAGRVTRDALDSVFAAADFVVSTSARTNMTNAVIEAMAYGVPCVAVDSGSTAAVVRHERTGLLVGEQGGQSIAEAMDRLATDAELRKRLGDAAREFVTTEFERVDERLAREVDLVISIARGAGGRS